ncbi:MAG: MFS transporter, partial [Candidatus Thorarchaeota archaeon]
MSSTAIKTIEVENNKLGLNHSHRLKYKSNLIKLYLFNFFIGFSLISGVLIPFYLLYGGFTFLEFMFLQSYYAIMLILFGIPCGVIADHFSRKTSLILASFSYLAVPFIYGIVSNKFLFIIGETLFAFSNALISGSNEAIIYDNLKKIGNEKYISKSMAKNDGMFLLGIIISAPLGSIIAELTSIRIVILLMIIPYLISAIITITIQKIDYNELNKKKSVFETLKSGFNEIKKNKILRILIFEKII